MKTKTIKKIIARKLIGDNSEISNCSIENTILMKNCKINVQTKIKNSIISNNSEIIQGKISNEEKIFLLGEGTKISL